MSKSIEEQIGDIADILGGTDSYCIKGATFPIKEDLKSWGWFWDSVNGFWKLEDVAENDPALKAFKEVDKTWIEKIR